MASTTFRHDTTNLLIRTVHLYLRMAEDDTIGRLSHRIWWITRRASLSRSRVIWKETMCRNRSFLLCASLWSHKPPRSHPGPEDDIWTRFCTGLDLLRFSLLSTLQLCEICSSRYGWETQSFYSLKAQSISSSGASLSLQSEDNENWGIESSAGWRLRASREKEKRKKKQDILWCIEGVWILKVTCHGFEHANSAFEAFGFN